MLDGDFASDNGAPCPKCSGTIYRYRATGSPRQDVTSVAVDCVGCGERWPVGFVFAPRTISLTAAQISAAHRVHWETARRANVLAKTEPCDGCGAPIYPGGMGLCGECIRQAADAMMDVELALDRRRR